MCLITHKKEDMDFLNCLGALGNPQVNFFAKNGSKPPTITMIEMSQIGLSAYTVNYPSSICNTGSTI